MEPTQLHEWQTQNCKINEPARGSLYLASAWDAHVWYFRPSNVLEDARLLNINWGFSLSGGEKFTDSRHSALLETSRQLIYLIRGQSLTGSVQRVTTTLGYFYYLKILVQWMVSTGYTKFGQLNAEAVLQFKFSLASRPGIQRVSLAPSTVQKYLYIFTYLYRFREKIDDGITFIPFPGSTPGRSANVRESDLRRWPYTPDVVAVPLVKRCIDLLTVECDSVLQAMTVYLGATEDSDKRGIGEAAKCNAANKALRTAALKIPFSIDKIESVAEFSKLVDMLYAACFVVISYLVGPRASEILQLQTGCVKYSEEGGTTTAVIVGAIFKRQPEFLGRTHEWVAPTAAVRAIEVLEKLSFNHRLQASRPHLWLRQRGKHGAKEWQKRCSGTLEIPTSGNINYLLQRLASWLNLPTHQEKSWILSTHQGRKTFVRFAALRDRTSLYAIAEQLGHRERAITDSGYSGSDYRLQDEIDAEVISNSTSAWETMLASESLGGMAGAEIERSRPRFLGDHMKLEVKAYARMLVDAGLTLGVCDWGYCVYREGTSACLGNAVGPNPVRREPTTCARCSNFVVTPTHQPYWLAQRDRYGEMLDNAALPKQTLNIARTRYEEARLIINKLDGKVINEEE